MLRSAHVGKKRIRWRSHVILWIHVVLGLRVPWRAPDPRHSSWFPEKTPRSCNASWEDPPIRDQVLSCNHRPLLTTGWSDTPKIQSQETHSVGTFFTNFVYGSYSQFNLKQEIANKFSQRFQTFQDKIVIFQISFREAFIVPIDETCNSLIE